MGVSQGTPPQSFRQSPVRKNQPDMNQTRQTSPGFITRVGRFLPLALVGIFFLTGCDQFPGIAYPNVYVLYRQSLVGAGRVLILKNDSTKYLHELTITITRNGQEIARKGIARELAPGDSIQVGWVELGVALKTGDNIKIYAKGYIAPWVGKVW